MVSIGGIYRPGDTTADRTAYRTGDGRQETREKKQETGDRRQETGERKPETRSETGPGTEHEMDQTDVTGPETGLDINAIHEESTADITAEKTQTRLRRMASPNRWDCHHDRRKLI